MHLTGLPMPALKVCLLAIVCSLTCLHASAADDADVVVQRVKVFQEPGRFGGWPANHGIWNWGNEILVGFSVGYHKNLGPALHNIDRERPEEHVLARSLDGGNSWSIEHPAEKGVLIGTAGMRHGTLPTEYTEPDPVDCPGGIDFTHPDFAMTLRMAGTNDGESRFYYSLDRGHSWKGPFRLPLLGQPGIAARTDYIVNGPNDCLVFLTASKANQREGRPICARTTDGGKSWKFVSYIGDEPKGFGIMPSTVRLSDNMLLTAIRRREGEGEPKHRWNDLWLSRDNGQTWEMRDPPIKDLGEGNPPSMIRLVDGRVCLTYGYRAEPFNIAAKISKDAGETWSDEIVLRTGGGGRDIGYPRTIQRPDGKVVTIYYFWDNVAGPERFIEATIWEPSKVKN